MAYTAEKPKIAPDTGELRNSIPGWGVDLDPKNRPAVPKEHFNPEGTGAHWEFPERQKERWPREKSPEHKFLTPVCGTVRRHLACGRLRAGSRLPGERLGPLWTKKTCAA